MLAKTKNYRPSDKEPFMNERQREYFRAKLLAWREDILKEAKETLQQYTKDPSKAIDAAKGIMDLFKKRQDPAPQK